MNPIYLIVGIVAFAVLSYFAIEFIGGKVTVIADWKRAFRYYSVWGIAVLGAWPDLYNLIQASGFLGGDTAPESLTWGGRVLAIVALAGRFIRQKQPAIPDDTDKAGA